MKLIAHRSKNNHNYKENSIMASIDTLNKDYIDGIEIDIRFTKDKKIIMYHNYLYNMKIVNNLNYNDIKGINLLESLLKRIKTNKIILLDIKCENNNYKEFCKYILKLINKYKNNYYLCSFNYNLIKYLIGKTRFPLGIFITDFINKNKNFSNLSFLALSKNSYNDIDFDFKFVWTINNKRDIKNYMYIITDKAYLLSK